MIDDFMLGRDSQGRSVRNEYGEMVRLGTGIWQGGKAKQDAMLGRADKRFNDLIATKQKTIDLLRESGDAEGALNFQGKLDDLKAKYEDQRSQLVGKGFFERGGFGDT